MGSDFGTWLGINEHVYISNYPFCTNMDLSILALDT